nr:hypothetical protein [Mameliella sediminis]
MQAKGFREIEKALAELPASTAKGVARRAMRAELKPVAATANALWPGASEDVFRVAARLARGQRGPRASRSVSTLYVGAPGGMNGTPEAHLIEFGTGPRQHKSGKYVGAVAPSPMLGPAWDMHKHGMIEGLGAALWAEIERTMKRRAAKGK